MNRQNNHQQIQNSLQNGTMKAYKFQFDLLIEHISIALSFPCQIQILWKRGTHKIYTKNKSELNLETRFADFHETLSMMTTIFQTESNAILPKKSSLTVVIQTPMGNKVGGVAILNLNEFLPNDNTSLFTMKSIKHTQSQILQLQKCPDQNAYIRVQVTSQFVSECLDNETMSIGSCGSRLHLNQEGDEYLVDYTTQQMNALGQQNSKISDERNNFTFSMNNVKSEPSLKDKTNALTQYDNFNKVPTKEQIEETLRHKKRMQQFNLPSSANVNGSAKRDKRVAAGLNTSSSSNLYQSQNQYSSNNTNQFNSAADDKNDEVSKLKYENQRLKEELLRSKFRNDTDLQSTMMNIESENERMKNAVKILEEEKQDKIEEIKRLQSKIEEFNNKLKQNLSLQEEQEEKLLQNKKANDKIVEQLENLQKEFTREMEEKQILINKLKKDKQQLIEENERIKNSSLERLEQVEQTSNKLIQQNNDLVKKKQQLMELLEEMNREKSLEKDKYERQIEINKQQIESALDSNKKLQSNYDMLFNSLNQEKLQNQQQMQQVLDKNRQLMQEIKDLQERIEEQESENMLKDQELEQLRDEIKEKEIEISQQLKGMQEIKLKIQTTQQKNEQEFLFEIRKKDDLIENQIAQIQALHTNYEELEKNFETRQQQLEERIKTIKESNNLIEQNLQKKELQVKLESERCSLIEKELEMHKQLNIQLSERYALQIQEKEAQIEQFQEQLQICQKENKQGQAAQLNQTSYETENLKIQLEEQKQLFMKKEESYKKQLQKLARMNEKLEEENMQMNLRMMKDLDQIARKQEGFSKEYSKILCERKQLNVSVSN
ncbi:hypothetical protein TTHERM_00474510 (macronuclear) [Tetrahymena thermophila SB210]|uniref:C2 NT-type domain-containing protein n=1 Tax=Tetrahymena thermophila (strain SB210) TaxID=312017 RepID=I7LX36_TETTS|nr:hypothetical protein TTHERM_00474510 [Tetrahymena thermophila SB210]EAS03690.2 hypothetical protein TTHERM_00474510 [Tetrahymena thermophila SB210]|eukprot:XP_001023935.2 hypothetical protein TTHERM_00474510 [Tetrahymena thermophila SB210]